MPAIWQPAFYKPQIGEIVDWDTWGMGRPKGEWWLNEGSGNLANDASGNRNTGTLTNMDPATDWVGTKYGIGLDFDGSNDQVRIGNLPGGITYSGGTLWATSYMRAATGGWQYVLGGEGLDLSGLDAGKNSAFIRYNFIKGLYETHWSITAGLVYAQWTTDPIMGIWITLAGVRSSTATSLYCNGSLVASSATSGTPSGNPYMLIGAGYRGGRVWKGQIGCGAYFSTALAASQVQALQGPVPIWSPRRYWWLTAGGAVSAAYYQSLLRANRQGRAA